MATVTWSQSSNLAKDSNEQTSTVQYDDDSRSKSDKNDTSRLMEVIKEREGEIIKLNSLIKQITINNEVDNKSESRSTVGSEANVNVIMGREDKCSSENDPRGDPAKLIPSFVWDPKDLNKTKRFVNSFRVMAMENKWTEAHSKAAFESKLSGKGHEKYFEGLGDITDISFEERLVEFEKLFSRELTTARSQDLFWNCYQGKSESVTSFKLRLVSLGNNYKRSLKNDGSFGQLQSQQFIKGLKRSYRDEVTKADITEFDEAVRLAIRLEDCGQRYSDQNGNINIVQDERDKSTDKMTKLESEIEMLTRRLREYDRPERGRCWGCGESGHI